MRRNAVVCLLLALSTLVVYWPVGHYPFIAYDDPEYVAGNPHISAGLSGAGVIWAISHLVVSNWHPITALSHMLDCELFGVDPGAHHLVNVGFHTANTLLLFLLLQRTTRAFWRSALVAGFFALHPLHVESVAWISERKDVLSTFFFLLTLTAYAGYVERSPGREGRIIGEEPDSPGSGKSLSDSRSPDPADRRGWRSNRWLFYGATCLLFALGLLSKPMLVTLPFVLFLFDFWPLGRFDLRNRASRNQIILEKFPFFALSAACSVVTLLAQRAGGAMQASAPISLSDRLANAVMSYWLYLGKAFWPVKLAVIYPHRALSAQRAEQWPLWQVLGMVLLLLLVSLLAFAWAHRRPWLLVGWCWYLGTLVPVIGLIQVGTQAMADRYMYIPLIGVAIGLVWGMAELRHLQIASAQHRPDNHGSTSLDPKGPVRAAARAMEPRSVGGNMSAVWIALCVLTLGACGAVARHQVLYWRSTTQLFGHAVEVTRDNTAARALLAVGLEAEGRIQEAIAQYREVAQRNPQFHAHLALLLSQNGALQEAVTHYAAAAAETPNELVVRLGFSQVLQKLGRDREAAAQLEVARRIDPNSIEVLNNLAWLRATHPDTELRSGAEAIELAERACRLSGNAQTVLLGTLAAAYAEGGRFEDAVSTAQRACRQAAEKGEADLLQKNGELLKSYANHQPFRQLAAAHPSK